MPECSLRFLRSPTTERNQLPEPVIEPAKMNQRRTFLQVLGGAAAGFGLSAIGCGSTLSDSSAVVGDVKGGLARDVPLNSLNPAAAGSVAIGRDASGLYALTTICTHQGCDIGQSGTISASGLTCGCHGSRFDANGAVLSGPASQPLDHYAVAIEADGTYVIHVGSVVPSDQRTPVPA